MFDELPRLLGDSSGVESVAQFSRLAGLGPLLVVLRVVILVIGALAIWGLPRVIWYVPEAD